MLSEVCGKLVGPWTHIVLTWSSMPGVNRAESDQTLRHFHVIQTQCFTKISSSTAIFAGKQTAGLWFFPWHKPCNALILLSIKAKYGMASVPNNQVGDLTQTQSHLNLSKVVGPTTLFHWEVRSKVDFNLRILPWAWIDSWSCETSAAVLRDPLWHSPSSRPADSNKIEIILLSGSSPLA